MADGDRKDFDAMLHDGEDMPKMRIITNTESIKKYGDGRMYSTPPVDYDTLMRRILFDKVTTVGEFRDYFAQVSHADFTEPITAGILVPIAVRAGVQRGDDPTPYWRTLKASGELNTRYPGGMSAQKEKLEVEGYTIICRGRKNIRYLVKDYENALFDFTQGKQAF